MSWMAFTKLDITVHHEASDEDLVIPAGSAVTATPHETSIAVFDCAVGIPIGTLYFIATRDQLDLVGRR